MLVVLFICAFLVITTTFLHYEVLGLLNAQLPNLPVPTRVKVALVILAAFVAHAVEITIYASAYFITENWLDVGVMQSTMPVTFFACLCFSAEAFTSLGFGDITPIGPIRLLGGVEALNGLLLIAWSASFTYLSMERFWAKGSTRSIFRNR